MFHQPPGIFTGACEGDSQGDPTSEGVLEQ